MLSPASRVVSTIRSAADRYLLLTLGFTKGTSEPKLARGQARLITVT